LRASPEWRAPLAFRHRETYHDRKQAWAEHGHQERRKGEQPADFAWFYFMRESDADAFRRAWL